MEIGADSKSKANSSIITPKTNICLYGPPGCGKSTVSKILGKRLNMEIYDVDDDHLETDWNMTVAAKLEILGDEAFLKSEEESTLKIDKQNVILALTGSNALSEKTMVHLRRNGIVVYIDVEKNEIIRRCKTLQVDRIVGMASKTLDQILDYRREIYEKYFDYRIPVESNEHVEVTAERIVEVVRRDVNFIHKFENQKPNF